MSVRRFVRLLSMLTALIFYSSCGQADTWHQALSARVATEYESNPAMIPAFQDEVWRSIFEPGYRLTRTEGANEVEADVAVQIARSSNKVLSPNRQDARGSLDWRRHSETGEFGLSTGYQEIGTRLLGINTGLGVADNTQTSRTVSARWNQSLSEQTTLGLDGSYERVSYQGGTFVDYATRSTGMKLGYAWSEFSTLFLRMSYSNYEPANGNPNGRLISAMLGWNWKMFDDLEGSVQIGKSRVNESPASQQGAVGLQYSGERTGVAINASRQVLATGFGGFITVDQVKGSWNYALSEQSKTGIDLEGQKNFFTTNIINYTTGAWLQYDTNPYWRTRMYYQRKISRDEGIGRAYSNILGVAVAFTPSDF